MDQLSTMRRFETIRAFAFLSVGNLLQWRLSELCHAMLAFLGYSSSSHRRTLVQLCTFLGPQRSYGINLPALFLKGTAASGGGVSTPPLNAYGHWRR